MLKRLNVVADTILLLFHLPEMDSFPLFHFRNLWPIMLISVCTIIVQAQVLNKKSQQSLKFIIVFYYNLRSSVWKIWPLNPEFVKWFNIWTNEDGSLNYLGNDPVNNVNWWKIAHSYQYHKIQNFLTWTLFVPNCDFRF